MSLKKVIIALSLFLSTSALAESVISFEEIALQALVDQSSEIDVKGEISGVKLSRILGSALFTFNNQNVSLQIFNTCELSKTPDAMDCRLSIIDTEVSPEDGENIFESSIIIDYKATLNKDGSIKISETVQASIAG